MSIEAKHCIICNKQYSQTQKALIKAKLEKETSSTFPAYPATCLSCIQESLNTFKETYLPDLKQASNELKLAEQAYKKALFIKQELTIQHNTADQQQQYIKFFLQQEAYEQKQRDNKSKTTSTKKAAKSRIKQADIINTLLASLTPEQRALVAAKAKLI